MYQNVLIKTISSSDTVFDIGVNFDIFRFCDLWQFCSKNISLENGIFEIYFRQSAKCKMTAQTGRKYHVFAKICYLECILQSKRRFFSSDPFCVCCVQLTHFTGGMFPVCTIDPISPIYPIYPMYPICPIYCFTISYYCALLCAISVYFGKVWYHRRVLAEYI